MGAVPARNEKRPPEGGLKSVTFGRGLRRGDRPGAGSDAERFTGEEQSHSGGVYAECFRSAFFVAIRAELGFLLVNAEVTRVGFRFFGVAGAFFGSFRFFEFFRRNEMQGRTAGVGEAERDRAGAQSCSLQRDTPMPDEGRFRRQHA